MRELAALRAGLRLMRPAQWPILSIQLVIGMLLTAPLAGPARLQWWRGLDVGQLGLAWLVWVVLLNGSTLAFNSAYDRDTGPVAYLRQPPVPPRHLAQIALGLMALGVGLGFVCLGSFFGVVVAAAVALSVLYSHPATRWKSRPGLDLLTNVLGYGLGTTLAGISATTTRAPDTAGWWLALGFGLLFGSFYPLTQIYQMAADRARGDRTLVTALGVRRALQLALALAVGATGAFWYGCDLAGRSNIVAVLLAGMALWLGHVVWWLIRGPAWPDARHEQGMYRALGLWGLVDILLAIVWLVG